LGEKILPAYNEISLKTAIVDTDFNGKRNFFFAASLKLHVV